MRIRNLVLVILFIGTGWIFLYAVITNSLDISIKMKDGKLQRLFALFSKSANYVIYGKLELMPVPMYLPACKEIYPEGRHTGSVAGLKEIEVQRGSRIRPDSGEAKPYIPSIPVRRTHSNLTSPLKVNFLFWNMFHGRKEWWHLRGQNIFRKCGDCFCSFTYDKRGLESMDAVLFEYNDDLLRSEVGIHLNVPLVRYAQQYWILYNHEPERGDIMTNNLYKNLEGGVFNLSATYRNESDITLKYGECLRRNDPTYSTRGINFAEGKTGLVVWLVSNCAATSQRLGYARELQKYISVDIAGRCGTKGFQKYFGPISYNAHVENLNKYKFYLAFENTYCEQYITEKVYKVLSDDSKVVPIVRGAGPYKDFLPVNSYIDAADFSSPKDLADYLIKLDQNDDLYNEYFKAREKFICHNYYANSYNWPCAICQQVCALKEANKKKTLNQNEINKLFVPSNICYYPSKIDV